MAITGIIFDLYGTLIDIETDESMEEIYRGIAHFLTYEGIYLHRGDVSSLYWQLLKQQKQDSNEKYPEINVEALWNSFLKQHGIVSSSSRKRLSLILSHLHRGLSRKRLQLYPDVQQVLEELKPNYRMGIVSDAQSCFALPEIKATGLAEYFDPVVISGSDGYRKPDPRLFEKALDLMKLKASQVIYVGNDMYRDIHGAQRAGIKTIFVNSNQGEKQYEDVKPDYFAHFFKDVSQGIASLA
jgi:putative hydrolase of the HAD superfamily